MGTTVPSDDSLSSQCFTPNICYTTTNNNDNINADEIPTIDYSVLFSSDPNIQAKALDYLSTACHNYGFFYLVNHGVPEYVFKSVFKAISDYFDPTMIEDRMKYQKKSSTDMIRWELRSSAAENREYLKMVTHPNYHSPSNQTTFSETMEDYYRRMREVVHGLGKAISKTLGMEESFIEKAFKLESGFDVSAMNLYPPNFKSKGSIGVPDHTDPGFFVSLIQDINGGLQILSHQGKWIDVNYMPSNAILINTGDHLEILSNGKYKSHVHRVVVDNNNVKRVSVATLHGPSLDAFVKPMPEFLDDALPPNYDGTTYKHYLEANGQHLIDVQSNIQQFRHN
ncbi:2-oxoglutarate-dependent dioxygenase 19-like [Cannabis sativa]|uniref:2-oxoglutarate-dependent dioxygenase 19-like n=1 Tax=Cannabis sativa TaxID=3483 RepID=UPI0011DFE657|nr:2-oxoglutarate-dependent dioxygenase 19-like [Cannabis sativa]